MGHSTRPFNDILRAWHGALAYDPALVRAIAIIRGEWDGLFPDEDASWLFEALRDASEIRAISAIQTGAFPTG